MKETKNSALITTQAFYYQNIVALEKCFNMQEGDSIYIEKDGDISHLTDNPNMGYQIEVKDVKTLLTDHNIAFWKTLRNWIAPEFNHYQYKHLILYTTQLFGKTTQLSNWNDKKPQEKLNILENIYSQSNSETEIKRIQETILNTSKDALLEIIEKVVINSASDNKDEILNRIKKDKLLGIPDNNKQAFIENLIGFIYEMGNKECWCIQYDVFKEKLIDLTSHFSRKEFTFPEFKDINATTQEITENIDREFVVKIKDIEYEEVIPEAIGHWLEFSNSLIQELDNSPIYLEKTRQYQEELILQYKPIYRQAKRNNQDPQDLYDQIMSSTPLMIGNYKPHFAYRNGALHDSMDTNIDLKWDTKK